MYRTRYQYLVKFCYPVVSGKHFTEYLPDNISVFEIGETGVKTLEQELKSFATQALSQTQKNVSEPQMGIEPATF